MELNILRYILLMSLFGVFMVRGDPCPSYTGVTCHECTIRIPACVVQTFVGSDAKKYTFTGSVPFDIIVTDTDITGTDTVTFANFDCDGGEGIELCHTVVLDSNAQAEMTFHKDNSATFSIHGLGTVSFYIDDGTCDDDPCTHVSPRVNGVYDVSYKGDVIEVFCEFRSDHGYVFLPTSVLQAHPNIDEDGLFTDRSKALIKFKYQGSQYDAEISQLPAYSDNLLSVQSSANVGYNAPRNVNPPFQYLGIVPQSEISRHTWHGYDVNGFDYSFRNCDGNPNSYFVFFLSCSNMADDANPDSVHWGIRPWFTHKDDATAFLPDRFFYCFDMHQGGCGVYHRTKGAALGLRFSFP